MAYVSWSINIDHTLYEKALKRARQENKNLSQVIERMLVQWANSSAMSPGPSAPSVPTVPSLPSTPSAPAGTYDVYTVRSGDSLAQIAVKFYGNAKLYTEIMKFNNITDPTLLRVGQRLRIPKRSGPSELPTVSVPPQTKELKIEFIQSPHFNERPEGARIWAIVIHSTANSTLEGVIKWFTNPIAQVSAHYNIGKDGRIAQMARDEQRAWHAGKSTWKNVPDCNDYTIGIELVNLNNGTDPYPAVQYQTCVALCKLLVAKYNIKVDDIMGHKDISLSGKTDPAGFDLDRLRRDVAAD